MKTVLGVKNFYWELKDGVYLVDVLLSDIVLHNTVERALEVYRRYDNDPLERVKFRAVLSGGTDTLAKNIQDMVECALNYILLGVSDPSKNPSNGEGWELCEVDWGHPVILEQLNNFQKESFGDPDKIPGMTDWDWEALRQAQREMHAECGGAFANLNRLAKEKGFIS